jgi:hypothetical protein
MAIAPTEVIWQIVGISLGMVIFSQIFSKKFGTSAAQQLDVQQKVQEFQQRLMEAQHSPRAMQGIQMEMMTYMKTILKKQILPMCVQTIIFFAVYGLLALLYGQYTEIFTFDVFIFGRGYFALYFLVSLGFSLTLGLIKAGIRKIRPPDKSKEVIQDSLRVLQQNIFSSQYQYPRYGGVSNPNPQERMPSLNNIEGEENSQNSSNMMDDDLYKENSVENKANKAWKTKINPENATNVENKAWKAKLQENINKSNNLDKKE